MLRLYVSHFLTLYYPAVYASLDAIAPSFNMSFNTKRTVCTVFKVVCKSFPHFTLADSLQFVIQFKYLGIIDNPMSDCYDIDREITSKNLLIRRISKYPVDVEVKLLEPTACVFTT